MAVTRYRYGYEAEAKRLQISTVTFIICCVAVTSDRSGVTVTYVAVLICVSYVVL
jgi:hypothetical protein